MNKVVCSDLRHRQHDEVVEVTPSGSAASVTLLDSSSSSSGLVLGEEVSARLSLTSPLPGASNLGMSSCRRAGRQKRPVDPVAIFLAVARDFVCGVTKSGVLGERGTSLKEQSALD